VDEGTFKHVNLNLLIVFAVLMRERSVTRAARRLAISQPAISAALKKLRSLFNEALFTRIAIGITPTRRAHEIHRTLLPSLEIIEGVLRERDLVQPGTGASARILDVEQFHTIGGQFKRPRFKRSPSGNEGSRREKSAKTTSAANELPRANVPDKSTAVRPRSLAPQKAPESVCWSVFRAAKRRASSR
jgi:Bacterial regulatory helix-turn-helix protein, lysR family